MNSKTRAYPIWLSAFTIEGEGAEKQNDLVDALNQGSGYLRKLLGGRMRLRVVPAMKFFYDEVQQTGSALSSLIDDAVATNTTDADSENPMDETPASETSASESSAVNPSVWKKSL